MMACAMIAAESSGALSQSGKLAQRAALVVIPSATMSLPAAFSTAAPAANAPAAELPRYGKERKDMVGVTLSPVENDVGRAARHRPVSVYL
jgi:hypothetical protein